MTSKFYSVENPKEVCYGFKVLNWQFNLKFPKVPNVFRGQVMPPDEMTGTKNSQWNFQGFRNKHGEPWRSPIVKNRAQLSDVFLGQRYRHMEEAVPLDTISAHSDHIYAEIELEENEIAVAPDLPPRADTPTVAPGYPQTPKPTPKQRRNSDSFAYKCNW